MSQRGGIVDATQRIVAKEAFIYLPSLNRGWDCIAVSVYVLVAIVKKHFQLPASLHDLLQILSVTLFEREPIDQILTLAPPEPYALDFSNQLTLFDF